jgi:hypothetical protein
MDLFPRSFLIVFGQLAVGGILSLSIPPFHVVGRGYYKSTAAVYLGIGLLVLAARVNLWQRGSDPRWLSPELGELALWAAFCAAAVGYVASLRGERYRLRARAFTATWALGIVTVALAAWSYCPPGWSLEAALYPLSFIVSAVLLGCVTSGMLLGHWYLIDRDLPLDPLQRLHAFYAGTLGVQAALFALLAALLAFAGQASTVEGLQRLVRDHLLLFGGRVLVSPLSAGVLAVMIGRTLQIPQTMAATGLFYIAILAVLVGELMGRFVLFRTGLPF